MLLAINPPIKLSFLFEDEWHVVNVLDLDILDGGKTYPKIFSENESCIENWIQQGDEKVEYTDTDLDKNPDWWKALDEAWSLWLNENHG